MRSLYVAFMLVFTGPLGAQHFVQVVQPDGQNCPNGVCLRPARLANAASVVVNTVRRAVAAPVVIAEPAVCNCTAGGACVCGDNCTCGAPLMQTQNAPHEIVQNTAHEVGFRPYRKFKAYRVRRVFPVRRTTPYVPDAGGFAVLYSAPVVYAGQTTMHPGPWAAGRLSRRCDAPTVAYGRPLLRLRRHR